MDLSKLMEFDHVIEVRGDGSVVDAPAGIYAPEVIDGGTAAQRLDVHGDGWTLLSGYTGQYGYRGPVMHASEYIGGRLADDILAEPGYYVAVVVTTDDPEYADDDIIGWAVARREVPCSVTSKVGCVERSCELHWQDAPLRLSPDDAHGYVCKRCGSVSPLGVGYVAPTADAARLSAEVTACACGYSRKA